MYVLLSQRYRRAKEIEKRKQIHKEEEGRGMGKGGGREEGRREGGREGGKDGGEATIGQPTVPVHGEPKLVEESPWQGGGVDDGREEKEKEEGEGEGEELDWGWWRRGGGGEDASEYV